jgi:hypothetical protein
MLKNEEYKMQKKIELTRKRADQILKIKLANDQKYQNVITDSLTLLEALRLSKMRKRTYEFKTKINQDEI